MSRLHRLIDRCVERLPRHARAHETPELRVILRVEKPDVAIIIEVVSMSLFDHGAVAVGELDLDSGPALSAGFPADTDLKAVSQAISTQHEDSIDRIELIDEAPVDWVESQRSGLRPTQVGPWHIRAPWHDEPDIDPLYDIIIDPDAAFGHGGHPSTMLAIELLTRRLAENPRRRVFDIGTGTGVLAIIAGRLGATVIATDTDNDALTAAFVNIERNSITPSEDLEDRVALLRPDLVEERPAREDIVVANVTIDVHRTLAPEWYRSANLICSGLLCPQVREAGDLLVDRFASTILVNGNWAAVEYSSSPCIGRKT